LAKFQSQLRLGVSGDPRIPSYSSRHPSFHSANSVLQQEFQQQIYEALANLATATKSDRSAIFNLTDTNSSLTHQLTQTNAKLESAQADINALHAKVALLCTGNRNSNSNSNQRNNRTCNENHQHGPPVRKHFNTNYCWTHGYHITGEHTSVTCQATATGHKCNATQADTMGGTERFKDLIQ
jgi:hypothetical protein